MNCEFMIFLLVWLVMLMVIIAFVQLCEGRTFSWPTPGKPLYNHIEVKHISVIHFFALP